MDILDPHLAAGDRRARSGGARCKLAWSLVGAGLAILLGGSLGAWPGRALSAERIGLPFSISPPDVQTGTQADLADGTPLAADDQEPGKDALGVPAVLDQPQNDLLESELEARGATDVELRLPFDRDPESADRAFDSAAATVARASQAALQPLINTRTHVPFPALPKTLPAAPLAVMVENAVDARPQSGLLAADIVFEAMAEGGISRFMAVYLEGTAQAVGPVRSARHYFVNLAREFNASLVFIGASPLGYETLRSYGLRDLDETFGHPGFWRSRARYAPHNAYTSVAGAREALEARTSAPGGTWAGFTFKDATLQYTGTASAGPRLDYDPWGYQVTWRYDAATNRYARFMDGAAHRDAETGVQIHASSLAVLTVSAWVIDDVGRLDMSQLGSGHALYFVDGVVIEGTWSKTSYDEPTSYLDADGVPIRFNPGPLWTQIISPEGRVTY